MNEPTISTQQYLFLKNHKKYHFMITFLRFIIFIAFVFLWETASELGWIDSFFFSSPTKLWSCFLSMITEQSLFTHIGISLLETIFSFLFIMLINATLNFFLKRDKEK